MRYWTVDEARAYLPRLALLLGVIRRASHLAVHARGNGHARLPGTGRPHGDDDAPAPAPASRPGRPGDRTPGPGADGGPPADELPVTFDAQSALDELEREGIVLRDPDSGLVDFPARHPNGRDVLLCWKLGEDDLGWWHLPEDGFAGRRPLPLPPVL